VRIESLKRKVCELLELGEAELLDQVGDADFNLEEGNQQQRALAMKVLMFNDVLDSVLQDLLTHKLTD